MVASHGARDHYGATSLVRRIDEALLRAGLADGIIGWADLAPLDQFHVRGLAATRELAEALGIAGAQVLDVGCGLGGPARFLAATYGCHVTGIDLSHRPAMRNALAQAGFEEVSWIDKTGIAQAWTADLKARRQRSPAPFGLEVVMGSGFTEMAVNLGRNLLEGRVRIIQAVMAKSRPWDDNQVDGSRPSREQP